MKPLFFFAAGLCLGVAAMSFQEQPDTATSFIVETGAREKTIVPVPEIPASEIDLVRSPWGELLMLAYKDARRGWHDLSKLRPRIVKPETIEVTADGPVGSISITGIDKSGLRQGTIYDLVVNMPEADVRDYLDRTLNIAPRHLDQRFTLAEVAQHLYNMALRQTPHPTRNDTMQFGLEVNPDYTVKEPKFVYRDNPKRIYASFTLPRKGMTKVIVKWHKMGDAHPFLFETERMDPATDKCYVYYEVNESWDEGSYLVEIFDPADLSAAITSGSFFIEGAKKAGQDDTPDK